MNHPAPLPSLNDESSRRLAFFFYRFRLLIVYIAIGLLSLALEFCVFRILERYGVLSPLANIIGIGAGILFAYFMNVRFNFKVPQARRNRALLLFVAISFGSALLQFALRNLLDNWSYETARVVVSGSVFLAAYALHRRFSFSDFKRVGVAIYANGIEDIGLIHSKIGAFADEIHVDIVDESFRENPAAPQPYRMEVVRAYWPGKPVHVHVMSRQPTRWIDEVAKYSDLIILHTELDEDLGACLEHIHQLGRKAGLCLTMKSDPASIRPWISQVELVMILAIPEPGKSGQRFDMNALYLIEELNSWAERPHFDICVDGGVNERNIALLQVEHVVSGSSVLKHPEPARQIMRLQTSSSHERY